jgi:hypothetical protein
LSARNLRSPGKDFTKDFKERAMANQSIIVEFWEFLKVRKRFWLLPIVLVLFLLGTIIVFTESSAIAPFIYALF